MPIGIYPRESPLVRFLRRVKKSDGCWEYLGPRRSKTKYGEFWLKGHGKLAHRVSYMLHVGPIPKGKFICHHCDNPNCVNPTHLYVGDAATNAQDRTDRNRLPTGDDHWARRMPEKVRRGEKNNKAKLTENDVLEIRKLHSSGICKAEIARRLNVSPHTPARVLKGDTWRHVA